MKTAIDAMKRIANLDPELPILRGTLEWYMTVANSAKLIAQEAIAREEAKPVEVARAKELLEIFEPPLSAEREALISAMNMYAAAYPDSKHFKRVVVMLAADAQAMLSHGERAQFLADTLRELDDVKAQQVAVPQGFKLMPTKATPAILAAMASSQATLANQERLYPLERILNTSEYKVTAALGSAYRAAILAAAPQPPQAERVPQEPAGMFCEHEEGCFEQVDEDFPGTPLYRAAGAKP